MNLMNTLPAFNILISYDADNELWQAHCLEMDLMETGESRLECIKSLFRIIPAQIQESIKENIHYLHPAPAEFFQMLERAHPVSIDELVQENSMPSILNSIYVGEVRNHV